MLGTYLWVTAVWVFWLGGALGFGLVMLHLFRLELNAHLLVPAIWIGISVITTLTLILSIFGPVGGNRGFMYSLILLVPTSLYSLYILVPRLTRVSDALVSRFTRARSWPSLVFLILLIIAALLTIRFATGEPMDGDAGLYRLGSIDYASQFGTVPGLANLHDRFGFNSSLWPLASLMGTGPWSGEGFRLISGFFLIAILASTFLKVSFRQTPGPSAGSWLLVIGTSFTLAVALTETGRWLASPSQDLIALITGVVSLSFFLDYLTRRTNYLAGNLALLVAALSASIRPLGWVLFASIFLVLGLQLLRIPQKSFRERIRVAANFSPALFASVLVLAAMIYRDYLLSGWVLYPSSLYAFDVPWLAPDPTGVSQAITAWGRLPWESASVVLASNDWVGPWTEAFLSSRELYLISLMAIGLVVPLAWSKGRRALRTIGADFLWTTPISILLLVTWFITAPDVRFGWIALFAPVGMPLALLFAAKAFPEFSLRALGVAVLTLMAVANFLNGRIDPRGTPPQDRQIKFLSLDLDVKLGPANTPELVKTTLADGTPATFGAQGTCYLEFPLCIRDGQGQNAFKLGDEIKDGFGNISRSEYRPK